MYGYCFSINLPVIEADTYDEAKVKAEKLLMHYAKSYDGNEFLADSDLDYRGSTHTTKECNNEQCLESSCTRAPDCCKSQTAVQPSCC
jgi:hypothetical protein